MKLLADVTQSFQAHDDHELTIKPGDVVEIERQDGRGWWEGRIQGAPYKCGFFPSDFVALRSDTQSLRIEQDAGGALEVVGPAAELRNSQTRFGMWASNMTVGCSLSLIGAGTVAFYWLAAGGAPLFKFIDLVVDIYAIVIGTGITIYEARWTRRSPTNFPWRSIIYTVLAVPTVFSITTLVPGVMLVLTAAAHMHSSLKSEVFVQESRKKPASASDGTSGKKRSRGFLTKIREDNQVGEFVWLLLWIGANAAIFFYVLFVWFQAIDAMPANFAASQFVAWAKAWGGVLDFNCALILLPVCRTFIRYLYDLSTQSQTRSQRILRRVLAFIPLDKALEFHKMVAWLVLFAGVMHTLAHLVNYGLSPDYTWQFYGIWPWTTGVGIFICMMFMYGAAPANVKNHHFEIFWYSHHFFIGFFVLLIPHGRGGFNRNVWKGLIITVPIYILERIYRASSAYRTVALTSITNMGNVIALAFDRKSAFPNGYKEGQYLFLNAPHISVGEWHPFTISSAPQEQDVTVHIRVLGQEDGSSWTARLADYCSMLMPARASFASFVNNNDLTRGRGKVVGPDGRKLFRVYGPHSAPTQHVSEYLIAMVIGAGIGVTPVCATVKSIVHYRWKFSIGRSYPDHAYFYFVVAYKELDSFRWFIRMLKSVDDEAHNLWAANPEIARTKTFEFHIFVTSVPANCPAPKPTAVVDDDKFWGPRNLDDNVMRVRAPWDEMQMLMLLKCPPKATTVLGNIHVHNGRPNWDEHFETVATRHAANDIGVAYCGNPFIAKDLRLQCARYSSINSKTFFRLHKENF